MEGLNALKTQVDCLSKKHAEYFYQVIWMDQKQKHVDEFMENLKDFVDPSSFNKLLEKMWLENHLDNINKILFNNGLKNILRARQSIINKLISDFTRKKGENDEIFGKYIPQIYELLTVIFQNTTCNEKNLYFHTLVDYYYLQLSEKLKKLMKLNIARLLPVSLFEQQIKIFLPIVKLEKMRYISTSLDTPEDTKIRLLKPVVSEIYEYFKYPNFLREDCLRIIEDHVGPYNYKMIKFKLTPCETREDMENLTIFYYKESKEESLLLLVKHLSDSIYPINFAKEEFFYSVFVPRAARYIFYDTLNFIPKCYFVRHDDVLVLENVSNRNNDIKLEDFVGPILNQLSKLHACSLILNKLNKSLEQEFFNSFTNLSIDDMAKHISNMIADFILENFPDIPIKNKLNTDEFREKTKSLYNEMFRNLKQPSNVLNVMCYGNFTKNSIIFKESEHAVTNLCYFINYENIRYGPLVLDVLYFITSNTTKEFRTKSMSNLLKRYYDDLSSNLQKNKLSELFSFGNFLEHCNYFKETALCMCLCPMELLHIVPKKMPNTEKLNELLLKYGYSELRIKELVEELYNVNEKAY